MGAQAVAHVVLLFKTDIAQHSAGTVLFPLQGGPITLEGVRAVTPCLTHYKEKHVQTFLHTCALLSLELKLVS